MIVNYEAAPALGDVGSAPAIFLAFMTKGDLGGSMLCLLPVGGSACEVSCVGGLVAGLPCAVRRLLLREALFSVRGDTDLSEELSS